MKKITSFLVLVSFVISCVTPPAGFAQSVTALGLMSQPITEIGMTNVYTPSYLKGMVINPNDPFKFDFIIYRGDEQFTDIEKRQEYSKLIKYFLASLAVPDKDQWVNLSPYEQDRIIPDGFGKTEMGRDLLAQDYLLKQLSSSLSNPDTDLGKQFWDEVYSRAYERFGSTAIPNDTFNKIWITPDRAVVYEKGDTVYVMEQHLKVMMEQDYLSALNNGAVPAGDDGSQLTQDVMREVILPAVEKEVNEGRNFAPVRQVFSGMLLASWYKKALKESIMGKLYADQQKLQGVDQDPAANEQIYTKYVEAFKTGVFDMIKEDLDQYTQTVVPRRYFSGGIVKADFAQIKQDVPESVARQDISKEASRIERAETVVRPSLPARSLAPVPTLVNIGGDPKQPVFAFTEPEQEPRIFLADGKQLREIELDAAVKTKMGLVIDGQKARLSIPNEREIDLTWSKDRFFGPQGESLVRMGSSKSGAPLYGYVGGSDGVKVLEVGPQGIKEYPSLRDDSQVTAHQAQFARVVKAMPEDVSLLLGMAVSFARQGGESSDTAYKNYKAKVDGLNRGVKPEKQLGLLSFEQVIKIADAQGLDRVSATVRDNMVAKLNTAPDESSAEYLNRTFIAARYATASGDEKGASVLTENLKIHYDNYVSAVASATRELVRKGVPKAAVESIKPLSLDEVKAIATGRPTTVTGRDAAMSAPKMALAAAVIAVAGANVVVFKKTAERSVANSQVSVPANVRVVKAQPPVMAEIVPQKGNAFMQTVVVTRNIVEVKEDVKEFRNTPYHRLLLEQMKKNPAMALPAKQAELVLADRQGEDQETPDETKNRAIIEKALSAGNDRLLLTIEGGGGRIIGVHADAPGDNAEVSMNGLNQKMNLLTATGMQSDVARGVLRIAPQVNIKDEDKAIQRAKMFVWEAEAYTGTKDERRNIALSQRAVTIGTDLGWDMSVDHNARAALERAVTLEKMVGADSVEVNEAVADIATIIGVTGNGANQVSQARRLFDGAREVAKTDNVGVAAQLARIAARLGVNGDVNQALARANDLKARAQVYNGFQGVVAEGAAMLGGDEQEALSIATQLFERAERIAGRDPQRTEALFRTVVARMAAERPTMPKIERAVRDAVAKASKSYNPAVWRLVAKRAQVAADLSNMQMAELERQIPQMVESTDRVYRASLEKMGGDSQQAEALASLAQAEVWEAQRIAYGASADADDALRRQLESDSVEQAAGYWKQAGGNMEGARGLAADAVEKIRQAIQPEADKGGIDMNAAFLDMQIKRDGNGVPLPVSQQDLENIRINGLVPVILSIKPVVSSPIFQ